MYDERKSIALIFFEVQNVFPPLSTYFDFTFGSGYKIYRKNVTHDPEMTEDPMRTQHFMRTHDPMRNQDPVRALDPMRT